MVFTKLGTQEKDAFFSLLDEYFTARPEILNAVKSGNTNTHASPNTNTNTHTTGTSISSFSSPNFRKEAASAGAAVHKASDVASKFVSSGFGRAQNFSSGGNAANAHTKPNPPTTSSFRGGGGSGSTPASQRNTENIDTQVGSLADRIKALQGGGGVGGLISSNNRNDTHAHTHHTGNSNISSSSGGGGGGGGGGSGGGASSGPKKFGNIDTSAVSNMLAQRGGSAPAPPKAAPPPPAPAPPKQKEPEGEWAEALYDYESAETGDLPLKEGQRVLVVEHTSDDWWTGEAGGKQGLFPAAYVQLV